MYLNKAIVYGNITKDVEARILPSGQQVANFSVATNLKYKDKNGTQHENTEFHNVSVFGRLAELCAQYLQKGSSVYVEGRLQTRQWIGQGGITRRSTDIVAQSVQFGPKPHNVQATLPTESTPSETGEMAPHAEHPDFLPEVSDVE